MPSYAYFNNPNKTETEREEDNKSEYENNAKAFKKWENSLTKLVEKEKEKLQNRQKNTNKRMAGYYNALTDHEETKELLVYVSSLQKLWENKTIPKKLKIFSSTPSKSILSKFLIGSELTNIGYSYYRQRTDTPRFEERYKHYESDLNNAGINSLEEAREIYKLLQEHKAVNPNEDEEKIQREIEKMENDFRNSKDKGFFPTPKTLAERLVMEADIEKGDYILEPSAGLGHICEAIIKAHPDNKLDVIELNYQLVRVLKKKGLNVVGDDFLNHRKNYDKIIMNPPFEKLQDTAHVQHAYSLLNDGGKLVSIMGESAFFNSSKKAKLFREWLDDVGGYSEKLPIDSFKGDEAFRQTGVHTRIVIISKLGSKKKKEVIKSDNSVKKMAVNKIKTDVDKFQNRKNSFSESSKNKIIDAVKDGSFDWAIFDAITVWMSSDSNYYVISGHSRLSAFKELSKTNPDFKEIPIKIFNGTEKQAIDLALNSNTLSTKESDIERAMYYSSLRDSGKKDSEITELARKNEGKNANQIINLSYLNHKGFIINQLENFGLGNVESRNNLLTIANWVGESRKKYKKLSNSHEDELSKFLIEKGYGTKKGQFSNKREYFTTLETLVMKNSDAKGLISYPLNIAKNIYKSSVELNYDEEVNELKKEVAKSEKELKIKSTNALQALKTGKTTREHADKLINEYSQNYARLNAKLTELKNKKDSVIQASKQQTSLFGVEKEKKKESNGLESIFSNIANPPKADFIKSIKLKGQIGFWMGDIELFEYSLVLRGDKGAGKSRLMFQLMDVFAEAKKKVCLFSLEMDARSKIIANYRDEYILNRNKKRIQIASEAPKGIDTIREAAKHFDVVCIDSWQKVSGVKQEDFDKLRKEFPDTAFIIIFQSNTKGGTRGGNMADYDAQAVCHVKEGGRAIWEKNRFGGTGTFKVFEQKLEEDE